MAVVPISGVLAEIASRAPVSGIRLVGVDGPSGSGKSTLARRLAGLSGASLVQIDDFVSWHDFAGWWPRFEQEVLTPLVSGRDAHYRTRDWDGDEFGSALRGWKTRPWAPLVVIEGVTCTRAAAVDRLAYTIWVEAPEPLRLERGLARDGESHRALWQEWMITEREFFADDGTRERADLLVDSASGVDHDPDTHVVTVDRGR